MSRNRVKSELAIKSWNEADAALKQILECENLLTEQEVELNRKTAEIKEQSANMCKPMQDKVKLLAQQLKEFSDNHRDELEGKTKALNFGKMGYRLSTTLTIKKDKEDGILQLLKKMGLLDCITVKETINRDSLKRKPPDIIAGLGANLSSKDEFWYETDREQLQSSNR